MFAEVILSKATSRLDKIYHYEIPKELESDARIGSQVEIPFGRRMALGYIVGIIQESSVKGIKKIKAVISDLPLFTEKQVRLAKWLSEYYCSFFISALRLVMPPGVDRRSVAVARLESSLGCEVREERQSGFASLPPTDEQQAALDKILSAIEAEKEDGFLLYGVTGSGKTEVYMQAIARVLQMGKGSIVLVPEISLTPQLVQRFRDRFKDHIAVLHSHMTVKQRNVEWGRIASGKAQIVVGARSALFAPIRNLGLIVIDEEYENTYKQDKNPRYHVREVALYLAKQHGAIVILGSATPSIETYFRAEREEIRKLVLSKRIDNRALPPVEIIDMRHEKRFILSQKLRDELKETISRGEQAILFINRRGFFTFVMCKECGFVIQCPKCSISLAYHSRDRRLLCNRCGHFEDAPMFCPRCNSSSITYFGTGTQRIEKEVADIIPAARIIRYDRDAVGKRGSHEVFFSAFAKGEADVLIGTQMVTKGMDVANVTLVGVVSADTALRLPDFRAAEHTFQLLTQVAGRAGRHHLPGKVIIQTYDPGNYAIQAAARHDYQWFYDQEIEKRRELGYPPFSKLISLLLAARRADAARNISLKVSEFLRQRLNGAVLGPAPAIISKLRGEWRFRILLKGRNLDQMRDAALEALEKVIIPAEVKVAIDVEPVNMM